MNLSLSQSFISKLVLRRFSSLNMRGLVLGVFEKGNADGYELTETASKFDKETDSKLSNQLKFLKSSLKKGSSQLFFGLHSKYECVSIVNLGKKTQGYNEQEQRNDMKESIRTAASVGCRSLRNSTEVNAIEVDSCGEPEAAAEGCVLGLYSFDELKREKSRKRRVETSLCSLENCGKNEWNRGVIKADSQNIARRLTDSPSNHMTPTIFGRNVQEIFNNHKNVNVILRDEDWAKKMKMGSYLSVARGSSEPAVFIETHYQGADSSVKPILLVGKGITFDTGGTSLKPGINLDKMRADMGGAGCLIGVIHAISKLEVPINVIGLTPMTENMIGASATKPGDVVTAMNGKTIQVDNTDAEGRLILADGLCYAETFNPKLILDMATLTGAIKIALGCSAAGAFTTSSKLYETMLEVSKETGDRVWRLPIFDQYLSQLTNSTVADTNNIGSIRGIAGACVAAAFLKQFVTISEWMHLDISNVKENANEVPHLGKGFTGRPLRTIVEFLIKVSDQNN